MEVLKNKKKIILIAVFLWFIFNLFFLESFPFVHSDEIWLAGTSRAIFNDRSLDRTEPFFDLLPRTAHGMRILFHGLQGLFLGVLGFSVLSIRIFSLTSGAAGLILFYFLLKELKISPPAALAGMILLSLDIQFVYASHLGRQEIQLTVLMLLGLFLFFNKKKRPVSRAVAVGLCTGGALGIHPNAFITAWPVSLLFLAGIIGGRIRIKEGLIFLSTAAGTALVFLGASLLMNPDFLSNYQDFGRSVGVRPGIPQRLEDFPGFFKKLFYRISGTYYTPDIRPQLTGLLILPLVSLGIRIPQFLKTRRFSLSETEAAGWAGLAGITTGIFLAGKYSQPSIVFLFPFLYLFIVSLLSRFFQVVRSRPFTPRVYFLWILPLLWAAFSIQTIYRDIQKEKESYGSYLSQAKALIPENSRILGNLTLAMAVKPENLLDFRNLAFLEKAGLSFEDYVISRNVDYIIDYQELDYIFNSRPVWNLLYGNLYPWLPEMRTFLEEHCELQGTFSSPGYGIRIVSRRYTRDWQVRVYRVTGSSSAE